MDTIDFLVRKALSRRNFMAGAGSALAATALAGCSDDGTVSLPTTTTGYTDTDILNFALNLEYLEAEFYLRAATGSGLATTDIGAGTSTTGTGAGSVNAPSVTKVSTNFPNISTAQQNIINELAYTEQEHVRTLRTALGASAVARPAIDLVAGFAGGVTAANAQTSTLPAIPTTFSPFASFDAFVVGGFLFEDVGVTAYNGAAPLISTAGIAAGFLAAAAGIMAVEAYHGGLLRSYLIGQAITLGSSSYPYPLYANRLELVRAALGGGSSTETALSGFNTTASTVSTVSISTVVPTDTNALAIHRTTDQVLHIVYGTFSTTAGSTTDAAGVGSGGFFPSGVNGNIKTTQS